MTVEIAESSPLLKERFYLNYYTGIPTCLLHDSVGRRRRARSLSCQWWGRHCSIPGNVKQEWLRKMDHDEGVLPNWLLFHQLVAVFSNDGPLNPRLGFPLCSAHDLKHMTGQFHSGWSNQVDWGGFPVWLPGSFVPNCLSCWMVLLHLEMMMPLFHTSSTCH